MDHLGCYGPSGLLWTIWAVIDHLGCYGLLWTIWAVIDHLGCYGLLWTVWAVMDHIMGCYDPRESLSIHPRHVLVCCSAYIIIELPTPSVAHSQFYFVVYLPENENRLVFDQYYIIGIMVHVQNKHPRELL